MLLDKGKAEPSSRLRGLIENLDHAIAEERPDLSTVKGSLVALLEYLCSPEGRTDSNCWATDLYWMTAATEYENLPEEFIEVFADMAGALHDTINHPEIAGHFDSLPEQLLDRARKLGGIQAAPN